MKILPKTIFLLLFSFSFSVLNFIAGWKGQIDVFSQNIVPNPSFEDTVGNFPFGPGYIYYSPPWYSAFGTVDYFNASDLTNNYGVPVNYIGGGVSHSGNGYAGIACYVDIWDNAKEFVEVPLIDTLKAGKKYLVSFNVV